MPKLAGIVVGLLLPLALCAPGLQGQTSQGQASLDQIAVRGIRVLDSRGAVEIEVETSGRVVPETQVLTGPDRLVIDFPNSVPGARLRSQSVYRGEVKDVRIGLFQANPPVTRVVLDLKSAQSYQVFPYGRTVMIKIAGGAQDDSVVAQGVAQEEAEDSSPAPTSRPGLVVANYTRSAERIHADGPAKSVLDVTFRGGMLAIKANKATLAEVLFAVQQRTGAEVAIAAGADQEKVVADLGPAPAPEVLSQLLNGSKFNFMILSAVNNPQQLERVILSPRTEGPIVPSAATAAARNNDDDDDEPPTPPPAQVKAPPTNNPPPVSAIPQEPKTPPDENAPQ
ncbi:MAG TPA: AMIN domain-containing protein [Candidatus Sulfotelmatobacter sp.]|nr:AMIN domain-containing protein [Candidatus Sulfotelmatobacter sp.]